MNKQEVIEKIKNIETLNIKDRIADKGVDMVIKNQVLDIISQIDEPQKVVVPKFVADFYESIKDDFEDKVYDLCLQYNSYNDELSSEVWGWIDCGKNEPIQTLVRMKLYGYDIEKEKLYTVEIPDPHGIYKILYLFRNSMGNIRIRGDDSRDALLNVKAQLTEAEIKKDFEWAWQWAKEAEDL